MYPLKFQPILKEMIWGGQKIPQTLGLESSNEIQIGESFAISGLPSDLSIVSNGVFKGKNLVELIYEFKGELLGNKVYDEFLTKFPLLIKFIDANDNLSIQVHPNDIQAKMEHNSFGKTEMWYVMESDENASLIAGFSKKTTPSEFENYHASKRLMELMESHPTAEGDAYFIPAGKVHSIGKGNVIAEIQQTSDITYRIYDFDRTDKFGKSRELHHELALKAMNFTDDESGKVVYQSKANESVNIASCPYFTTNILQLDSKIVKDYSQLDSFVILMNVGGECVIKYNNQNLPLQKMEVALIPACITEIEIDTITKSKLIEVYI